MTDTIREAMMKQLREGQRYDYATGDLLDMSSVMDDAADILKADAPSANYVMLEQVVIALTDENTKLAALLEQAQQVAVPAGWVLVPIEPTEKMLINGHKAPISYGIELYIGDYLTIYKAMLAAALKPPQPPQGDMTDTIRDELIARLFECLRITTLTTREATAIKDAADMLEADAQWRSLYEQREEEAHKLSEQIIKLRAQQVAVPAGYVLVPLEPTPQMSAAGFCVTDAEHDPAGVYRAMLSAAAQPPQGGKS